MPLEHATVEDKRELWAAVESVRNSASAIAISVARIEASVSAHMERPDIHQASPCPALLGLSGKLWAIGVLAVTALAGAAWTMFRGQ